MGQADICPSLTPITWFDTWPVRVGFVVDEVALEQGFLRALLFPPVSTIPQMLHTHRYYMIHATDSVVK
jgi:hypothetical protein